MSHHHRVIKTQNIFCVRILDEFPSPNSVFLRLFEPICKTWSLNIVKYLKRPLSCLPYQACCWRPSIFAHRKNAHANQWAHMTHANWKNTEPAWATLIVDSTSNSMKPVERNRNVHSYDMQNLLTTWRVTSMTAYFSWGRICRKQLTVWAQTAWINWMHSGM
jgi:hypothetical protein